MVQKPVETPVQAPEPEHIPVPWKEKASDAFLSGVKAERKRRARCEEIVSELGELKPSPCHECSVENGCPRVCARMEEWFAYYWALLQELFIGKSE